MQLTAEYRTYTFQSGIDSRQIWTNFNESISAQNSPRHRFNRDAKTQSKLRTRQKQHLKKKMNRDTHLWRPPCSKLETGALITTWWTREATSLVGITMQGHEPWICSVEIHQTGSGGDYGVQNLTGKITLGFTLGEGELRRKGIKISLSFIEAADTKHGLPLYR